MLIMPFACIAARWAASAAESRYTLESLTNSGYVVVFRRVIPKPDKSSIHELVKYLIQNQV